MEPVTLIAGALAAGALSGAGEAASTAVRDAYIALQSAVARRFSGDTTAKVMLRHHESDPETYEKPLAKHLRETGADTDPRLVELARALLDLMSEQGATQGKYTVRVDNGKAVIVGDHGTQHVTFTE